MILAKTRFFLGVSIHSDHSLIMMTVKLKLKKVQSPVSTKIRFDINKLQDPEIAQRFKATVGGKFSPLLLLESDAQEITDLLIT